jgi:hypothetical protein
MASGSDHVATVPSLYAAVSSERAGMYCRTVIVSVTKLYKDLTLYNMLPSAMLQTQRSQPPLPKTTDASSGECSRVMGRSWSCKTFFIRTSIAGERDAFRSGLGGGRVRCCRASSLSDRFPKLHTLMDMDVEDVHSSSRIW